MVGYGNDRTVAVAFHHQGRGCCCELGYCRNRTKTLKPELLSSANISNEL